MNTFSMEPAFCAVKLPCSEMNEMGSSLAFGGVHPLLSRPGFTFLFHQLCSSSSISSPPCSISISPPILFPYFFPRTSPLLPLSPLFLPSTPVSICCVWARLHGWRKGKERVSLNYTCSSSSAQIQSGPTRCLPSRFTAFVSFASLYMHLLYLCFFYCLCVFLCAALFNIYNGSAIVCIAEGP